MPRFGIARSVVLALAVAAGGCTGGEPAQPGIVSPLGGLDAAACTELPLPNGAPIHVSGTVIESGNASPPKPIANAMLSTEYGGLYLPYCDLSRPSPYYLFGAVTDANGHFEMDVRQGQLGFHSFATGYLYSRAPLDTSKATTVVLVMEKLPAAIGKPTVTNAAFDKTTVARGEPVTFSAMMAAADRKDPLSDENVLVEPTQSWGFELTPPSVGKKDDFPDGLWKKTFAAPATPGTYTYYLSATTAGCATSDVQTFTLQVQ